jgi:hypothetical protein
MLIIVLAIVSALLAALASASDNSTCSMFCKDFDAHITTEKGQGTLMVDGLDVKKLLAENGELKAKVTEAFSQVVSLKGTVQSQQVCFLNPRYFICLILHADSH